MEKNHHNFTALHKSLYGPVFNFISLRVRNKQEVEDLTQDVFLKAYNSWSVIPDPQSAKNFLYYIARQRMIDLWKSAKVRYEVDTQPDFEEFDQADTGPLPPDRFIENERKKFALEILNSLKPGDRDILYLRFLEEKEYKELAEILGITEEYARQKVSRALQAAKKVGEIKVDKIKIKI